MALRPTVASRSNRDFDDGFAGRSKLVVVEERDRRMARGVVKVQAGKRRSHGSLTIPRTSSRRSVLIELSETLVDARSVRCSMSARADHTAILEASLCTHINDGWRCLGAGSGPVLIRHTNRLPGMFRLAGLTTNLAFVAA